MIYQGDADLDFGSLVVWVSRGDTLPKGLEAPHLCLDPTSCVISGPALPERPAIVPGGAQGIVSRNRRWAILFPRPPVLADGDDRRGLAVDDGRVAAAGALREDGIAAEASDVISHLKIELPTTQLAAASAVLAALQLI